MEYRFKHTGSSTVPEVAEMRYRIGNKNGWIWIGVYLLFDIYFLHGYLMGEYLLFYPLFFVGMTIYLLLHPYLQLRKAYKKEKAFHNGIMPERTILFDDHIQVSNETASRTLEYYQLKKVYSLRYSYCLRFTDDTVLLLDRSGFTTGTFPEFKQFLRDKRPDLKIPE